MDWFLSERRFWLKKKNKIKTIKDLEKNILKYPPKKWRNYNSVICKTINVSKPKTMKIIKRGWKI